MAESIAQGGQVGWKMSKMPRKEMGATDAEIKSLSGFIAGLK
jgi:hypothetical protein